MAIAVPFPTTVPEGYPQLTDEPVFDPDRHLQLEAPTEIVLLADLGYSPEEIATKATPVAASSPFRMLSDEGAAIMLDLARRLRAYATAARAWTPSCGEARRATTSSAGSPKP